MKGLDISMQPAMLETVDTFLAAIPWTKRRAVIIYLREHGGRRFVRLRTFNKHRTLGHWYPTMRCYKVPLACAPDLGRAILSAAQGKTYGKEPEWWKGFEEQYAALPRGKPSRSKPTLPAEGDTDT